MPFWGQSSMAILVALGDDTDSSPVRLRGSFISEKSESRGRLSAGPQSADGFLVWMKRWNRSSEDELCGLIEMLRPVNEWVGTNAALNSIQALSRRAGFMWEEGDAGL